MAYLADRYLLGSILSEQDHDVPWESFSPEDWMQIVNQAQQEGVAAFLYYKLDRSKKLQYLPGASRDALRALYCCLQMHNRELVKEFKALSGLFAGAGIPTVALKGICYLLTIYPDPGLRPMVDLDLLIPAAKLPDAIHLSKGTGYTNTVPEVFPGIDELLNHAVGLQKETTPYTMLEIHYSLVAEKSFSYSAPVDWFWTQIEPIKAYSSAMGSDSVLMLNPTAQVLYASAHAMLKHGPRNTSMHWYYDIDQLVRIYASRLDWDLLIGKAREFEWSSAVYTALSRAREYFSTPMPGDLLDNLSSISDRNADLIAAYREPPDTRILEEYQKLKFLDWRGRIKVVMAMLVPNPAYMRWRYQVDNTRNLPGFYLWRWWQILKDGVLTLKFLVRKKKLKNDQSGHFLTNAGNKI